MHIVQVNYAYAEDVADPEVLLDRFSTLTGWSEAVLHHGLALRPHAGPDGQAGHTGKVSVVQRFTRDSSISRASVEYVFCREPGGPTPARWSVCAAVARAVVALRPDVVHVNGLGFPVAARWLRCVMPASTAIVVQDHAGGPPRPGWLRGIVLGRLLAAADAFIFTSLEQAAPWQQAGIVVPPQQVHQVPEASTALAPIGRDVARARCGSEVSWGTPAILWVGRLNTNKDPLTVLSGFELAVRDLPDATLTMVFGENELEEAVRQRVETSAALRARVQLVGRVPARQMPAFFSAADLFVLGSHHEGSGYALLEALACGTVPVVTDIPSFRVFTDRGRLGRLWHPGDAAACARALVEAGRLDLVSQRRRVRAHFERELSWPAVGRSAAKIYDAVLSRRRSVRPQPQAESHEA